MRFLVIYAHPVEGSFIAALHHRIVIALKEAGHEVDDCDLYREGFQPVLSRNELLSYYDQRANRTFAPKDIERLLRCSGLVLVFPTWWYGMPAILKGYIDRVWLPGVAFEMVGHRTRSLLENVVRFAVVTTYGSPWWLNKMIGDTNRRVFSRIASDLFARDASKLWLAQYGMDAITRNARERFLHKVDRRLREF